MAQEVRTGAFWRAVAAEFVGMTLFIFLGISSAIGDESMDDVKVSLAFGLAIATLAQSLGHVSGAHLNPAVTLGLLVSCQISLVRAALYVLAQMLGATVAAGILYKLGPDKSSLGVNSLALNVSLGQAFGIELLATFQLVLCVLATTDKRRKDVTGSAPLAIGLSVGLAHLAVISYTGCGINPARSFGPALVKRSFKNHWVYWVGPMLGGAAAALVYDLVLQPWREPYSQRIRALRGLPGEDSGSTEALVEASGTESSQWPRR